MNNILAIIVVALTFAVQAFAIDADASFREGTRTQVQSNIYAVAVTFPGNATITSNATVSGTLGVTGAATAGSLAAKAATLGTAAIQTNATVGGTLGVTGAATLTAGIASGVSVTNTFYTVAAGTANCITNVVKTRAGIIEAGTTTL